MNNKKYKKENLKKEKLTLSTMQTNKENTKKNFTIPKIGKLKIRLKKENLTLSTMQTNKENTKKNFTIPRNRKIKNKKEHL